MAIILLAARCLACRRAWPTTLLEYDRHPACPFCGSRSTRTDA